MDNFDDFAFDILENAKRFYELGDESTCSKAKQAYFRAALLMSVSSLEAIINGIIDEVITDIDSLFNICERAFLEEKEIRLKSGEFTIDDNLKMSRLTERIEVLFVKYDPSKLDKDSDWWCHLKEGIKLRNKLVHPKEHTTLNKKQISQLVESIVSCIDNMFLAVYKRKFPVADLGTKSKHDFGSPETQSA